MYIHREHNENCGYCIVVDYADTPISNFACEYLYKNKEVHTGPRQNLLSPPPQKKKIGVKYLVTLSLSATSVDPVQFKAEPNVTFSFSGGSG